MAFDDYSYKFYNGVVLNPRTLRMNKDDESTSVVTEVHMIDEKEDSLLTADHIRQFENSVHFDEDSACNDFVSKSKASRPEEDKREDWPEDKPRDSDSDAEGEDVEDMEEVRVTRQMIDEIKAL